MKENETLEEKIFTETDVESIKDELNDKYLRLCAEFDNYKKRVAKEKEDIKTKTKIDTITSILDLDNDLSIATKNDPSEGLKLIVSKVDKYLNSQGISSIPCDEYDIDTHEVISKISDGEDIIDVASKGYKLNDTIIRYPKVILGKK